MDYPIGMVADEAQIVVERKDAELATQISLIHMAISAIPNQSVKHEATTRTAKTFERILKGMMSNGGK